MPVMRIIIAAFVIGALLAVLAHVVGADAQMSGSTSAIGPGSTTPIGPGGIPPKVLSGGAAPSVGCTNQLVLDYSNSCALIAQAWGE